MKFYIQLWAPHFKDIDELEQVQMKTSKIVRDLETKSYVEWLKELGIFRQGGEKAKGRYNSQESEGLSLERREEPFRKENSVADEMKLKPVDWEIELG